MAGAATLIRFRESDHGSLGVLSAFVSGGAFQCKTIELPWKDNKPNISCIPDGVYRCVPFLSRTFGKVYLVTDVDGRTWILTHNGNWAGDISKGLRSNSNGCIIIGARHALIYGQMAVALSRVTLRRFLDFMKDEEFDLMVSSVYGGM